MATSEVNNEIVNCNDFTKCSICFENFKSPKCLPCSHSFCHECLKKHIEASCQSKLAPVGFSCPLCRDFIPVENISAKISNWANDFPNNDTLKKISETLQENLCDSCQRDGEDEEAKQFCLMCTEKLCNMCAKYHRRNLLTKDHEVLSFEKLQKSPIATAMKKSCRAHAGKNIKYYCKDHSVPCCTACVCTAHRKCDNIETATETAERLRKMEHNKLSLAMANLEKELMDIKQELEKNISNIEETSDSFFASAEELYTKILKHVERVRNEFLNKLSKKTKACKIELQENAESIEDKIVYVKRCRRSINDLTEETNDDQYVQEFHETSKKYTTLKDLYSKAKFRLKLVGLSSIPIAQDIERTKFFCDVNVVTIKKFFSEEKMPYSRLTSDISLIMKEEKKRRTGKRNQ
nr:tripartite motif-containing protein 45-like [Crassostrea gigas]